MQLRLGSVAKKVAGSVASDAEEDMGVSGTTPPPPLKNGCFGSDPDDLDFIPRYALLPEQVTGRNALFVELVSRGKKEATEEDRHHERAQNRPGGVVHEKPGEHAERRDGDNGQYETADLLARGMHRPADGRIKR